MFNMVMTDTVWNGTTLEEDGAELHVAAFYEDLRTGEWAKEIFDRIRSRVPRDTHTTPGLWRFDILQDDHVREVAVGDAADAAVIVVAARGTRPLPRRLLDCVEEALTLRHQARVGLVGILDGTDQIANETLPVYRQLQAICRHAKLRFFSLPARNLAPSPAVSEAIRFAANRFLDSSLSIEIHSYRTWGLNE
jgi:hypothetical protein